MRTKLTCKRPQNLNPDEYKQCYSLSYKGTGLLAPQLKKCRRLDLDAWVYLIKDRNGLILSWALVDVCNDGCTLWRAMFWTRLKYRGKGYGSRIATKIKKDFEGPIMVYCGGDNDTFFSKNRRRNRRLDRI